MALAYVPQNQIAQQLGVSTATISNDLAAIRDDWRDEAKADVQAALMHDVQSLDRLESQMWVQLSQTTDPDVRVKTATVILRCKERRAKYLGFDRPELIDVVITDDRIAAEIVVLRERLGYEDRPALEA